MASKDAEIVEYLAEIGKYPLLTVEQEVKLAHLIAEGNEEARQQMIRGNLRLVVSIAKKFCERGMPMLDLIEEGNLGLLKAVGRFNPSEGCKFSTYATWWIKQTIRRALLNKVKSVRIPAYMFDRISKWKRMSSMLAQKLGREPTSEEIGNQLNLMPEQLELVRKALSAIAPMGRGSDGESGVELENLLSGLPTDEEAIETEEVDREAMHHALDIGLTERERQVIELRYALNCKKNGTKGVSLTLDVIGARIGLTRERVRQIENQALRKLQVFIQQKRNVEAEAQRERTEKNRRKKKQ